MIRLAVIGCGAWGRRYIPSAREAGNCVVTHVAGSTVTEEDAIVVSSREWRKLIDAPVDAFVVATPPEAHEEICIELLSRGRPVMLEKPMALDVGSAMRIAQAAIDSGTPLLVAHQHLFAPAYEDLRDRLSGWRDAVVVSRGGGDGPRRDYSALWDYGSHDVAMFLGLTSTRMAPLLSAYRRGGMFSLNLQIADRTGLLQVWNDAQPKTRVLLAMGGPEVLVYDDLDTTAKLRASGRPVPVEPDRPLARAVRAFAKTIAGGPRDWRFDPLLGVEVTRILSQADVMTEGGAADDE